MIGKIVIVWKVPKYGVFSGPYFPAFGLNSISPYSVQMRENTDLKKLRIWTLFTQWIAIDNSNVLKWQFELSFVFRWIKIDFFRGCKKEINFFDNWGYFWSIFDIHFSSAKVGLIPSMILSKICRVKAQKPS